MEIFISNLNLRYRHQWVFNNLSLQFAANKWTTLLGQSGVGKTSILRFIAGLIDASDVEIAGHLTTDDNISLATRTSYMAQQDLLLPWLTVLENVLLGARLRCERDLPAKQQRAKLLLQQMGLGQALNLRPEHLSGGMRQRVALARVLIEDRPLVLMDEPFSALDTITRHQVQNLAAELLASKTVIFVTHDPLEALRLSDVIYVLKGEPVAVSSALVPEGTLPRDPTGQNVLAAYTALLRQLG
jgi:putative hydroxymethylpyrimidine transport system ATP-binding protein